MLTVENFVAVGIEANPHSGFAMGYAVDEEGLVTTLGEYAGEVEAVRDEIKGLVDGDSGVVFEGEFNHVIPPIEPSSSEV